jgi:hypothetical protein
LVLRPDIRDPAAGQVYSLVFQDLIRFFPGDQCGVGNQHN